MDMFIRQLKYLVKVFIVIWVCSLMTGLVQALVNGFRTGGFELLFLIMIVHLGLMFLLCQYYQIKISQIKTVGFVDFFKWYSLKVFFVSVITIIVFMFSDAFWGNITDVSKFKLVQPNYVGVGASNDWEDNGGNVRTNYRSGNFFYYSDSFSIENCKVELKKLNEGIFESEFIFWQCAYIEGFEPSESIRVNWSPNKKVNIFYCSFCKIIEAIINSFNSSGLFFLFALFFDLTSKKWIFDNFTLKFFVQNFSF